MVAKIAALPAQVRHLLLVVVAAFLTGLLEVLPSLSLSPTVVPFVGAIITYALAWVTPFITSYGVGSTGD
jgi:hypothetical protein